LTAADDDGIVVCGRKGDVVMHSNAVPQALRERLGAERTVGLVRVLETARAEWAADVLNQSTDRFEKRLLEGLSSLRVEMARGPATLREELARESAAIRGESRKSARPFVSSCSSGRSCSGWVR
jgi:hypothetical protein